MTYKPGRTGWTRAPHKPNAWLNRARRSLPRYGWDRGSSVTLPVAPFRCHCPLPLLPDCQPVCVGEPGALPEVALRQRKHSGLPPRAGSVHRQKGLCPRVRSTTPQMRVDCDEVCSPRVVDLSFVCLFVCLLGCFCFRRAWHSGRPSAVAFLRRGALRDNLKRPFVPARWPLRSFAR